MNASTSRFVERGDETDRDITCFLKSHRGAIAREIAQAIGMSATATRYRLLTCEMAGRIYATKERGRVRYYVSDSAEREAQQNESSEKEDGPCGKHDRDTTNIGANNVQEVTIFN